MFQPHRYTRTQLLLDQFAVAFKDCDELIITDIYAASEDPIPGVSGEMLAHKIAETTGQKVRYISGQDKIEETLEREVLARRPGDYHGRRGHLPAGGAVSASIRTE